VEAIVSPVEAAVGETTIAATHGNRANRAGSFSECAQYVRSGCQMPVGDERRNARGRVCQEVDQQRQRDKAERRNQRRRDKPVEGSVEEMTERREHAAAQALFSIGAEETETAEESTPGSRIGE
jgi:hypothetical protein